MIDFNDKKQVAKAIQYTNVNPNLTREGLLKHLDVCMKYDFQAAMIAAVLCQPGKRCFKRNRNPGCINIEFPTGKRYAGYETGSIKRND